MRQRRIGTVTLGISLVLFGVLFLVHIFGGVINYMLIFHLWPLILIVLGGEILFYSCFAPEKAGTYDFAAIVIIIMLMFLAMFMAGADWVFTNIPKEALKVHWEF